MAHNGRLCYRCGEYPSSRFGSFGRAVSSVISLQLPTRSAEQQLRLDELGGKGERGPETNEAGKIGGRSG